MNSTVWARLPRELLDEVIKHMIDDIANDAYMAIAGLRLPEYAEHELEAADKQTSAAKDRFQSLMIAIPKRSIRMAEKHMNLLLKQISQEVKSIRPPEESTSYARQEAQMAQACHSWHIFGLEGLFGMRPFRPMSYCEQEALQPQAHRSWEVFSLEIHRITHLSEVKLHLDWLSKHRGLLVEDEDEGLHYDLV